MSTKSRRERTSPIQAVMTWGLGGLLIAIFAGSYFVQRYAAISEARSWMVSGPACPTITAAQAAASGQQTTIQFDYNKVHYGRAYGYVNCNEVHPDWFGDRTIAICQFNSPSLLEVKAGGVDTLYASPIKPMTVSMTPQGPHCVMNQSIRPG